MNNKNIKKIVVIASILIIILLIVLLVFYLKNNDSVEQEYLKNYKVNEYIATYISDEDMAKIYLNDYIHNMYYDIESAYNSLNEEYRNKKFGSFESYKNYVYSLNHTTYTLTKYYKKNVSGFEIFGVYDNNGNFYAFKTKGVMQYTVYLDDYTIEI